jgi:hypothetical protein
MVIVIWTCGTWWSSFFSQVRHNAARSSTNVKSLITALACLRFPARMWIPRKYDHGWHFRVNALAWTVGSLASAPSVRKPAELLSLSELVGWTANGSSEVIRHGKWQLNFQIDRQRLKDRLSAVSNHYINRVVSSYLCLANHMCVIQSQFCCPAQLFSIAHLSHVLHMIMRLSGKLVCVLIHCLSMLNSAICYLTGHRLSGCAPLSPLSITAIAVIYRCSYE